MLRAIPIWNYQPRQRPIFQQLLLCGMLNFMSKMMMLSMYLVPKDALLGDFIAYVRMWIFLKKKKPIFVFFKNTVPPTGASMGAIDEENKDDDGFLHMTYSGNDTFSYSVNDVTC
ncbi:unnamed protein product [Prunus armeniaca]